MDTAHKLASKYESEIKEIVSQTFLEDPKTLRLMLSNPNGAYISKEDPNKLGVFVYGNRDNNLYIVLATIGTDGDTLTDFSALKA